LGNQDALQPAEIEAVRAIAQAVDRTSAKVRALLDRSR
jgi:hypothetical protein